MKTIGIIGTGLIGNPMARRLLEEGFHLKAHDSNPQALRSVLDAGAEPIRSPADMGGAEAALIIVNHIGQVNEVLFGEEGLVSRWRGGPMPIVVVMSTVSPEDVKGLEQRLAPGQPRLLDAAISGGPILAEQGRLAIMVGGPEREFARVRPVLEALGERIFHVGPAGAGMAIKLVNNMIAIPSSMIVTEALALGVRHGLDVERMVEIINASSGKTFITENWSMFRLWLQTGLQKGDPSSTRDVLFVTGRKDLVTAREWAVSQRFSTPVLDELIHALTAMEPELFLERTRAILAHPGDD